MVYSLGFLRRSSFWQRVTMNIQCNVSGNAAEATGRSKGGHG